jgi:hypothetical protein
MGKSMVATTEEILNRKFGMAAAAGVAGFAAPLVSGSTIVDSRNRNGDAIS